MTMESEREWFLTECAPKAVNKIKTALEDLYRRIHSLEEWDTNTDSKSENNFEGKGTEMKEIMKGNANLYACTIPSASIEYFSPKENIVKSANICGQNPWVLYQLQEAGDHVLKVKDVVDEILQDGYGHSSVNLLDTFLCHVLTALNRVKYSLQVPDHRYPTESNIFQSKTVFVPELAEDVIVCFSVQSSKLVFSLYYITEPNTDVVINTSPSSLSSTPSGSVTTLAAPLSTNSSASLSPNNSSPVPAISNAESNLSGGITPPANDLGSSHSLAYSGSCPGTPPTPEEINDETPYIDVSGKKYEVTGRIETSVDIVRLRAIFFLVNLSESLIFNLKEKVNYFIGSSYIE